MALAGWIAADNPERLDSDTQPIRSVAPAVAASCGRFTERMPQLLLNEYTLPDPPCDQAQSQNEP